MAIIYLYDAIERGAAAEVIRQLRSAGDDEIYVRINSPGGDVAEGIAIYNALRPYSPTVFIDGVAASIASFIAMAGAHIVIAENSLMMVHNPWVMTGGDSAELRQTADVLDRHRDALIAGYLRTGLKRSQLIELLDAETWLTATDAIDMGFADEIAEPQRIAAHAPDCFARFHNTPEELLMPPINTRRKPRAEEPKPAAPSETPATPDLETADDADSLAAFKAGLGSDAVAKAARDAVTKALKERNDEIQAMFRPFASRPGMQALAAQCLADPTITSEQAGLRMMALLGADAEPLAGSMPREPHVTPSRASDDFVQAASDSLLVRAGLRVDRPSAGMRDVMGMSLRDIVRACESRSGRSAWGRSSAANIRAHQSTSDFPAILDNALNKALRAGYENEPATFTAWTRQVLVPDFKEQSRVLLGSAPPLLKVLEGADYREGAMSDDKSVPYAVSKYGRIVSLTWETIVNDDLGAFLKVTQAMGQAASRTEADLIYATFAENGGSGPTMQDSVTLFHAATHGNLASSASSLDAAALSAARVLLRRQTALGGGVMNLAPRFLLVAPEHEQAAETLLASAGRDITLGEDATPVAAWVSKLELIVEARLEGDAFYLATSPDTVDTLERAWLESDNGPVISEESGFGVDSQSYKVRHVCGCRWLDWRGIVKVPISGA